MGDRGVKVTENNRRYVTRDVAVRVKRRGKSPPGTVATQCAALPVSCKFMYTGI